MTAAAPSRRATVPPSRGDKPEAGTSSKAVVELASAPVDLAENPKLGRQAEEQFPAGCCWARQHESKPMRRVVWGLDYIDEKVASFGPDDTMTLTLLDANYNIVAKTTAAGDLINQYSYSPYGEIIAAEYVPDGTDLDIELHGSYPDCHFVAGAWQDKKTGLVPMRARLYSPILKRFVSQDPNGQASGR